MKLAFFGGSFDPPHLGHEKIIKTALKTLDIDKLIIMPTYINPFKSEFTATPQIRYKWIKKLWDNLKNVEISTFEIDQNRPVPTIQSIKYLYKKYDIKKLYVIIGADHLKTLHLWDEFEKLKNLVTFVVACRDDIPIPNNLKKIDINVNISSSFIRSNPSESQIPAPIKDDVIKFYQGLNMHKRIEKIQHILNDKKAENIEIIDMSDKEYIAKYVIIATTLTGRHAFSLIDDLKEALKPDGEQFLNIESSDDWSVIDMGDIIIHLMNETYREKYNIEEFLEKLKNNPFKMF